MKKIGTLLLLLLTLAIAVWLSGTFKGHFQSSKDKLLSPDTPDSEKAIALQKLASENNLLAFETSYEWLKSDQKSYRIAGLQALMQKKDAIETSSIKKVSELYPASDEERLAAELLGLKMSETEVREWIEDLKNAGNERVETLTLFSLLGLLSKEVDAEKKNRLIAEILLFLPSQSEFEQYALIKVIHLQRDHTDLRTYAVTRMKSSEAPAHLQAFLLDYLSVQPQKGDEKIWDLAMQSDDLKLLKVAISKADRFCSSQRTVLLSGLQRKLIKSELVALIQEKLDFMAREKPCGP